MAYPHTVRGPTRSRLTSQSARSPASQPRSATLSRALPAPSQTRLALICALFAGCALVLVWRLFTLQVRDAPHYQQLGDDERRASIPIVAKRGALLDTNGYPLAVSVRYDSVYVLGSLVGNPDDVAAALSPILEHAARGCCGRRSIRKQRGRLCCAVASRRRWPSASSSLRCPACTWTPSRSREYPEGSLAAQVLGFVGHDFTGLGGLELSYDQELAGTPGAIDSEQDTSGQEITLARRLLTPPREGDDLVLTLDRYVQRTAERLLNQAVVDNRASGGLIMVMEAKTGALLAIANNPTYNLTADEIFDQQQADRYKSKVVTDQYEPGSTLKSIAMASAIDAGVVTPGTQMNDTGLANVAGTLIRNWNFAANGPSTMTDILIHSSNVGMTWVSGQLGPDRLYDYYARFGLGQPTGVRLPGEVSGTVRTPRDPGWTRVDLATNAYGQGIALTPMQLCRRSRCWPMTANWCARDWCAQIRSPDGVSDIEPEVERQVISPATAHTLLKMLVAVHEQEALKPYRVAGLSHRGQDGDGRYAHQRWLQRQPDGRVAGGDVAGRGAAVRGADSVGRAGEAVWRGRGGAGAAGPGAGVLGYYRVPPSSWGTTTSRNRHAKRHTRDGSPDASYVNSRHWTARRRKSAC